MEEKSDGKLKKLNLEDCTRKDYIDNYALQDVRKIFEARTYMLKVGGNFKHHAAYRKNDWKCKACNFNVLERQEHLSVCEGYQDIREGKDLDNDGDLIAFYRLVMERREARGWA